MSPPIKLPERFTQKEIPDFLASAEKLIASGEKEMVIDASDLGFIESMAIGQLIQLKKNSLRKKVGLTIINLQGEPRVLFEETQLDKIINIQDSFASSSDPGIDVSPGNLPPKIKISLKQDADICILMLEGSLIFPETTSLLKEQLLLSMAAYRKFLLNFCGLIYIDSLSVSELLCLHRMLKKAGGNLALCVSSGLVKDVLTHLSISRILPLFDTPEQAMLFLKPKAS